MAKAKLKWTKTTLAHDGWFWYQDAERSAVLLPLILALFLLTGCISSPNTLSRHRSDPRTFRNRASPCSGK